MKNYDVRCAIQQARLHQYEVAAALGINEGTFSRWLRDELPDEKKREIFAVIENLTQ